MSGVQEHPNHQAPRNHRDHRNHPVHRAGSAEGATAPRRAAPGRLAGAARRIEAATPPDRSRAVDAVRALAICGVVLGHWCVTALVPAHAGADGAAGPLTVASPLQHLTELAPVSWGLQTLALFFFAGGWANAASLRAGVRHRPWIASRLRRLAGPAAGPTALWAVLLGTLLATGVLDGATAGTVARLVTAPLWFLAVYALLTAATPVALAAVRRWGAPAAVPPAALVALGDWASFGPGSEALDAAAPAVVAVLGWLQVPAGWLVPFLLGVAVREGRLGTGPGRRGAGVALLVGGAAGMALLVARAGYPASAVGVTGADRSNLAPPSLFAVALGCAQVGLALLAWRRLERVSRRPLVWAPVAGLNLLAMPVFLWHQSALLLTTLGLHLAIRGSRLLDAAAAGTDPGAEAGTWAATAPGAGTAPWAEAAGWLLSGLLGHPDSPGWVAARLLWLPVLLAVLAGTLAAFRRGGGGGHRKTLCPCRRGTPTVVAAKKGGGPTSVH
ncbi:acyltransferase family protein [Allostreptomyces psammosilenae]|uniref:acyltransferase family protein n=1 Tax=Allostreptomyces psammosilenae TaxID=1892865 RepID=UPI0015C6B069|nr:acyltransferase [Allostreptomyces psammosilenae]